MMKIYSLLAQSAKDTWRNPLLLLPPACVMLLLTAFSFLSRRLLPYFHTNLGQTLWAIAYSIISLAVISFFFSGLLGTARDAASGKKTSLKQMFKYCTNRGFPNFLLTCIMAILFMAVLGCAILAGRLGVAASAELATIIFLLVFFAGLAGFLLFLTFANVYCVIAGLPVVASIKKSIRLVRLQYPLVLALAVALFIINEILTRFTSEIFSELVKSFIILPYLALVLVHFVLAGNQK